MNMKPGEVIWQRRTPGGECLIIDVFQTPEHHRRKVNREAMFWGDGDYPVLLVLHPEEGLIEDPSYYYETLEEAVKYAERISRK